MAKKKAKEDSDFLNDMKEETGLTGALAAELNNYVAALKEAKDAVLAAELELEMKNDVLRKLSEEILPGILAQAHLTELKLDSGQVIFVKEDLKCAIPKEPMKRLACFNWLRANGAEDIIVNEIVIPEVNNQKIDKKLLDKLDKLGLSYNNNETVNANTLKAYFREQLGLKKGSFQILDKSKVPAEFNLYQYKKADIK